MAGAGDPGLRDGGSAGASKTPPQPPGGVSWDLVKDFRTRDMRRLFARLKLGGLKRIAIDKIAVGKGHR